MTRADAQANSNAPEGRAAAGRVFGHALTLTPQGVDGDYPGSEQLSVAP